MEPWEQCLIHSQVLDLHTECILNYIINHLQIYLFQELRQTHIRFQILIFIKFLLLQSLMVQFLLPQECLIYIILK